MRHRLPRLLSIISFRRTCICVCLEEVPSFKGTLSQTKAVILWAIRIAIFVGRPCKKGRRVENVWIAFIYPKQQKTKKLLFLHQKGSFARLAISNSHQHPTFESCNIPCFIDVACDKPFVTLLALSFSSPNSITAEREMQRAVVAVPSLGFFNTVLVSAIDYNHRFEWSLWLIASYRNPFFFRQLRSVQDFLISSRRHLSYKHLHLLSHDPFIIVVPSHTWDRDHFVERWIVLYTAVPRDRDIAFMFFFRSVIHCMLYCSKKASEPKSRK